MPTAVVKISTPEAEFDMNIFKKELNKKLGKSDESIMNIIHNIYETLPPLGTGALPEDACTRCIAICALAEGFQRIDADLLAYIHATDFEGDERFLNYVNDLKGNELLLRMDRDIHTLLQEHGASFDKPLLKKIGNIFSNSNYAWFQAYGLFDGIDLVSGPCARQMMTI